jgi:hypothetical protein
MRWPSRQTAGKRRTLEGLACVVGTAVCWVAASFISQSLLRPAAGGEEPAQLPAFLLCYLCTSQFAVYLPAVAAARALRGWRRRRRARREAAARCAGAARGAGARARPGAVPARSGCTERESCRPL